RNDDDGKAYQDQRPKEDDENLEALHEFGPVSWPMARMIENAKPPEQAPPLTVGAEDAGERLDRFLARPLARLPRSRLKQLIEAGRVSESGATLSDPSRKVKAGQVFQVELPVPVAAMPEAQAIPLSVLHEDEDLIVVDKPAGMVVHPAPGNPDNTLVNALIAQCGES